MIVKRLLHAEMEAPASEAESGLCEPRNGPDLEDVVHLGGGRASRAGRHMPARFPGVDEKVSALYAGRQEHRDIQAQVR